MNITGAWIDFAWKMATSPLAVAYAQERKFIPGQMWQVDGSVWSNGYDHDLECLGYAPPGETKIKQLKRNYYNSESVEEAREKMISRNNQVHTSVGISTLAGRKGKVSQGHCIWSLVLTYSSPKVNPHGQEVLAIDIFYRTTELIRKFGADLIFFHDFLIPEVLRDNPWDIETPTVIRFHFSTCYFSTLFLPIFLQFVDPVEFLQDLKRGESTPYYRKCLNRVKGLIEKSSDAYGFRIRKKMQAMAQGMIHQEGFDLDRLREFIRGEYE